MFTYAKPEEVGISSKNIKRYIEVLEKAGLSTHSVIIARHDKIVYENYWAPFHKDFLHRMYSVTKSFVALGIGCLIQEGKLSLDDKIVDLFPAEITEGACENVKKQTIKNMLMMSTGYPVSMPGNWFTRRHPDRLRDYFESSGIGTFSKTPGSFFDYDSFGSFVLGALVEDLSGMSLMDYLRSKFLDKIGFSKEAHFLKCPGGHAWGDSALMCTSLDLLKAIKFTMNLGSWEGEQLMDKEYVQTAVSNLIPTHHGEYPAVYGYGYQIWRLRDNSFFFNGMGCQFGVCVPDKDLLFVYNGDNQGNESAKTVILDNFFNLIADETGEPMTANDTEYHALTEYSSSLILHHCGESVPETVAEQINGKTYYLDENPMGIQFVRFTFNGETGMLEYKNEQGEKKLPFGMGKNVFGKFPQEGYSDEIGGIYEPGHYLDCAVSAQWLAKHILYLSVQVIDKYFGRSHMYFSFMENGEILVRMEKTAEDFLNEYCGKAKGKAQA
ncbi:MAG: serine hydrolase [Ruminococcaceae bacterium]|nr:serine hydrolase [Oscillospiraceae bacterium]